MLIYFADIIRFHYCRLHAADFSALHFEIILFAGVR